MHHHHEVEHVFYDYRSQYDDFMQTDGFSYIIGYTLKDKFISFTFGLMDGSTIRMTQVYLSYEREIFNQYFFR